MDPQPEILEQTITLLIPMLMMIESGVNASAIGDGGRAIGILQIHAVVIHDVNRILGSAQYALADRKNPTKAAEICRIYLLHYGRGAIQDDMSTSERLILLGRIWNGGPAGYKKSSTLPYARKIKKQIEIAAFEPVGEVSSFASPENFTPDR